jgi:hypothetical protein
VTLAAGIFKARRTGLDCFVAALLAMTASSLRAEGEAIQEMEPPPATTADFGAKRDPFTH